MKKVFCSFLIALLGWLPLCLQAQTQVSPTRYDYSEVARQITTGCSNDYERAEAIYRWLCDNIAYDVSRQVYTADACWELRKGVCQAYCELFYRLAEPLGIRTEIISGKSKERNGSISQTGHSWLFVVTEKATSTGILVDPTWGAGYVDSDVFIRKKEDNSWFNVRPEWLIFTHLPQDGKQQFLSSPIDRETFSRLPFLQPALAKYGLDGKALLAKALQGDLHLPTFYDSHSERYIYLQKIPLQSSLRVGGTYDFVIRKKMGCKMALFCNEEVVEDSQWERDQSTYRLRFTPSGGKDLLLGIYDAASQTYQIAFAYDMESPTAADLQQLEQKRPFAIAEVKNLKNFREADLKEIGIDGHQLLKAVRSGEVTSLPEFYNCETRFTAVQLPLNGTLQCGHPYTFKLRAGENTQWAIVHQGQWFKNWTTDSISGTQEICITPQQGGELMLMVSPTGGNSYRACLKYLVTE